MLKAASASRRYSGPRMRRSAAPQYPVYEEAVHDDIAAARRCGVVANHIVGDRATEAITTAFSVEPEQMVAIGVRLDAP